MSSPFSLDLLQLIQNNQEQGHRPLLFANASVITTDSLINNFEKADVLLGGSRVVGIGPGLLTAADDDGAIVIDCANIVIVPTVIDMAQLSALRPHNDRAPTAIAPGNSATFALLHAITGESPAETCRRFLKDPEAVLAILVDGTVTRWNGQLLEEDEPPRGETLTPTASNMPRERLGTWIDQNDFVHQHLSADGRYDETRGGREHAYQGRFWINGDRIDYRDDLGFWAYGEFVGDTLQHAGYTFHRS